ncbi:MAG TPA: DUF952 domain-containing protein [Candidatus Limnocylindrales bacterium]|nr:DUF952 domain-containing protein [Candidatus Limnocylindrales bacterium]
MTRPTFHLVPVEVWAGSDGSVAYEAAGYAREGFIHCTDGVDALGATFDRHYGTDDRSFLALTIDLDELDVPWRFDVPGSPYPHIYGRVRREAITAVQRVERGPDGRFVGLLPS